MSNKLNALNAGQILGRSEMKKIMAGSGGGCVVTPCQVQYMCCCDGGQRGCASDCDAWCCQFDWWCAG
jgi:hypothetical protein